MAPVALINGSANLDISAPGNPPAGGVSTEKTLPQAQHAASGPENDGPAGALVTESRKSGTLWEKAVEGLKEKEREIWTSYPTTQGQASHQSIYEQIGLIREARDHLADKQMTFRRSDGRVIIVREKINSVLRVMDKYMAIGDIAIQHSPAITALVWAGVRLGLQLALNEIKTFEELASALEDVGNIVGRCRIYEELYLSRTSDLAKAVVDALPTLYTVVLEFIIEVKGYFDMKGMRRSLKVIIPFEEQFQPLIDSMGKKKEEVERRARVAHEVFVQVNMLESDEYARRRFSYLTNQLESFSADIASLGRNVESILQHQMEDKQQMILEWLSQVKCGDHQAEVKKTRLEGTGEWILQRREVRQWLELEKSSILWLHGKAGSGKTVLSSQIIDALCATHGSSSPVLFFYCNYKEQPRREADSILRTLLKQISGKTTVMDRELVSIYERAKQEGFNTTSIDASKTKYLFQRALPTVRPAYVVIDALDECEEGERRELVMALKSHASLERHMVKIFVTSRDEKDLARMFSGACNFQINADDTALDIRPFVEIKVQEYINNGEILGTKENVTPELRQDLVETLVGKADGMFLWVKYQLEHIRIQGSEYDLRRQLGKLPRGLDATYSRVLEKIDNLDETRKDWAYKTLKWLTCAARPLEPRELLEATALEPGNDTFELSKMSNISYLIETCCHLVTLDAHMGVVRFAHYSVQEFLQSRSEFSSAQELVARTCITSLGLWEEFGVKEHGREVASGLYGYAAINWPWHVQKLSAVRILQILPLLQRLFSNNRHFGVWRLKCAMKYNTSGKPLSSDPAYLAYYTPKMPHSSAPAYLAVCLVLGITAGVEFFLQDRTTSPFVKQYALCAAAATGDLASVQLLLENQVDINALGCDSGTALIVAAERGREAVVRLLLENGADINAQGGEYGNALQAAAFRGSEAIVRLLWGNGAGIIAQGDGYGNTDQAAATEPPEVVVHLHLGGGADIDAQGSTVEEGNGQIALPLLSISFCN